MGEGFGQVRLFSTGSLLEALMTLLCSRGILLVYIATGISPAKQEQKMSMVPYQEVQGTCETPWKAVENPQPGINAPPAGLI